MPDPCQRLQKQACVEPVVHFEVDLQRLFEQLDASFTIAASPHGDRHSGTMGADWKYPFGANSSIVSSTIEG
ncbi:hypothetical protein [Rhodococcus jostii]|uniref:hypothetical protein n=1 Tax=Rhodococcus jostii TaxID=132919 RepID=UPI003659DCE8